MFKHYFKKLSVFMIAVILTLGCIGANAVQIFAASTTTVGSGKYSITDSNKLTAQYKGTAKKSATSISIPDTITISGKTYTVTSITNNALKNNKTIKKLTIGKNVTTIGKNAFYGCKNLKTVTIKTTGLKKGSIGTKSFKGLNDKAVVTVPAEKLTAYKELLKSNGLTGKNQKVKGINMQEEKDEGKTNNASSSTFNTSESQFDPEHCMFEIKSSGSQSSGYSVGDTVKLYSKVGFKSPLYGHWEKDNRRLIEGYYQCGSCLECFSPYMLGIHSSMELYDGCIGNYYIGGAGSDNPATWIFVPDYDPCKTIFQYILPQGLSYKEESLKVTNFITKADITKSCKLNVSNGYVTVTINDIKTIPFYYPYAYEEYKKNLYFYEDGAEIGFKCPIVVEIGAEVTSGISKNSIISSTTSYSYKGTQHVLNYEAIINTASLQISNTDTDGNSISGAEFEVYNRKTTYIEGTNLGTSDWALFSNGLHAGDIVSGLGTGQGRFDNKYKVVQTKEPEGYKPASSVEFELYIDEKGNVSANDEDGNALKVVNGVVQINMVNTAETTNSCNTSIFENTDAVKDASQDSDSSSSVDDPVTNTSTSSGKKVIKVKATYYKGGEKEYSMTYQQTVDASKTMMDKKEIRDMAYVFKGCRLEKITLNGIEVDSLPAKVENGSEVCFYYVTE